MKISSRCTNGMLRWASLPLTLLTATLLSLTSCSQAPKKTAAVGKTKLVRAVKIVNGKRVVVTRRVRVRTEERAPASVVAATANSATVTSSAASNAAAATISVATVASSSSAPAAPVPSAPAYTPRDIDSSAVLSDVAFGSWANQDYPQPIWSAIQESKPGLFVFVGDTVKLDDRPYAEQYSKLDSLNEYRAFRETTPFLAVWNTQDYKVDTGQKDFARYWSYLYTSMKPVQNGIYHSQTIGPKGKRVQFLLLDTRSFRGPRLAGDKPNAPVLGEEQWRWLEEQMNEPSEVKFLISTIPLIPARQDGESWNNYPAERQRLFDLIKKIRPHNLVVVSGGAKQGSVATTGLKGWGPLYDITTGPLNDTSDRPAETDERIVGPTTTTENFAAAQIDWQKRLLVVKLLDSKRVILNSATVRIK